MLLFLEGGGAKYVFARLYLPPVDMRQKGECRQGNKLCSYVNYSKQSYEETGKNVHFKLHCY